MPVAYHEGRFPPIALDLGALFPLVGPASAAIARYEGVLSGMPNPDILLSRLTAREAVLSSKIERTQVTLGEVGTSVRREHAQKGRRARSVELPSRLARGGKPDGRTSAIAAAHEYYDRMLAVSGDDDGSGWVAFFLRGIIAQAEADTRKAQTILARHQSRRDWVVEITHSQYAVRALDWIF